MLNHNGKSERNLNEILESLSVNEGIYDTFYQTRSREDYDTLLDAALNGNLEGLISVGHTAIYHNNFKITPPTDTPN